MRSGTLIAFVLLVMVGVGHLLRLAFALDLVIEETRIPMWMSVAAVLVFGGAAFMLWRDDHKSA